MDSGELRRQAANKLASHLKWRAGALRFRAAVEERLADVAWRRLTTERATSLAALRELKDQLAAERATLDLYMSAVRMHRGRMADVDETDLDEADLALWAILPEVTPEAETRTGPAR